MEAFHDLAAPRSEQVRKGAKDERFITLADLATHLSHIPTGLGRFPLYISDMPGLYTFLRKNFYPMMQSGDRDLFALFVDTLRQYGCNPENDAQVRDGTRYLLEDFHKRGDKWMNYHEERKTFSELDRVRPYPSCVDSCAGDSGSQAEAAGAGQLWQHRPPLAAASAARKLTVRCHFICEGLPAGRQEEHDATLV